MSDKDNKTSSADAHMGEYLFTELILSFQAAAWQQLGKVPSIITGKVERELEMAKHSIDLLGMLEEKTKGNLNDDETRFLQHILAELRLNYLDELRKGPDVGEKENSKKVSEEPDNTAQTEK